MNEKCFLKWKTPFYEKIKIKMTQYFIILLYINKIYFKYIILYIE
jgi:hypothetical protein